MNNSVTLVGFPEDGKTSGKSSMHKVIQYAYAHEMGDGVPNRAFLRPGIDENRNTLNRKVFSSVRQITGGFSTVKQELFEIGEKAEKLVKSKIMRGPFTPLADSTVARKGHDQPLIDTKQMINTVQHKEVIRVI